MEQKTSQKFINAWIAGMCVAMPHVLLSTFLVVRGAYANCFGQSNEDLLYGIPYALLNIPSLLLPIPGITSIILFGIAFGIAKAANRKSTKEVVLTRAKTAFLFWILPAVGVLGVVLQIYFGTLSPPRGLCYRFPTWARPQEYYSEWLHIDEEPSNDPATCIKYRNLNRSQCIFDVAWKILAEKFPTERTGFACSEKYMKNPITVECQNSNTNPFKYEEFTYDKCEKFSNEIMREQCRQLRAIHNKDLASCDKIVTPYLREECYFYVDITCVKSSVPELRQACEVRKTIDALEKEQGY
ncbi:hypothetical protein EXS65_02930 [Candidatus Peribacteria bacterium]|nr:hypothetical protein [Candidatus Peribacteria bacterium]